MTARLAAGGALLVIATGVVGCGPKGTGTTETPGDLGGASQLERFEAAGGASSPDLPLVWKPGVRPPTQGSGSRLGIGSGLDPEAAIDGAPGVGKRPDPSGLSGLPPTGGEGARDVGPIHVSGGPGLPDGLLGASVSRLRFPVKPKAEEDTGVAVNALYELDWGGIAVLLKLQHRHAKALSARAERYVQRYWIYLTDPKPLSELIRKVPPLQALHRSPEDYSCEEVVDGMVRVIARKTSPLATAIGRGYSSPKRTGDEYHLVYELLFAKPDAVGPDARVIEVGVDVGTPHGKGRAWPGECF